MKKPEHLFNWNDNDKKKYFTVYIHDIEWNVENRFWKSAKHASFQMLTYKDNKKEKKKRDLSGQLNVEAIFIHF